MSLGPTPQVRKVVAEIEARFPGLEFQYFNCRRITIKWSQHAGSDPKREQYGNAGDVFDRANPYASPLVDRVYAFLVANKERLRINNIIWRKRNHWDHLHFDCWPKMKDNYTYKPPCRGGKLVTIDEDGTVSDSFALDDTGDDVENLQLGDQGNAVAKIQKAINGYRKKFQPEMPPIAVDSDYGPITRDAVHHYQRAAELPRYDAGIVGQLTSSLLMEFVQDWADPPPVSGGIVSGSSVSVDGIGVTIEGVITETGTE